MDRLPKQGQERKSRLHHSQADKLSGDGGGRGLWNHHHRAKVVCPALSVLYPSKLDAWNRYKFV